MARSYLTAWACCWAWAAWGTTTSDYTIHYYAVGDPSTQSSLSPSNETWHADDDVTNKLARVKRTGYTLPQDDWRYTPVSQSSTYDETAWNDAADNTITPGFSASKCFPIAPCRVYYLLIHAQPNAYPVTLNPGTDCEEAGTPAITATYDQPMPEAAMPTRKGHAFAGYFRDKTQYYAPDGTSAHIWDIDSSNIVLTAQWTANTNTITFDCDGGSALSPVSAVYGTLPPALQTRPTRTGYAFAGFYTKQDGNGDQYYDEDGRGVRTWYLTEDTTLYAKWEACTCRVYYYSNDGEGGECYDEVRYGNNFTVRSADTFIHNLYAFTAWNTKADGSGTDYQPDATYRMATAQRLSLYAQWDYNAYCISFDGNGGEGEWPSTNVMRDAVYTIPENAYARDGWLFCGWATNEPYNASNASWQPGTVVSNLLPAGESSAVTLHATWTGCVYTVALDAGTGGRFGLPDAPPGSVLTRPVQVGEEWQLPAPTNTDSHLAFDRWMWLDATNAQQNLPEQVPPPSQGVTNLVAIWTFQADEIGYALDAPEHAFFTGYEACNSASTAFKGEGWRADAAEYHAEGGSTNAMQSGSLPTGLEGYKGGDYLSWLSVEVPTNTLISFHWLLRSRSQIDVEGIRYGDSLECHVIDEKTNDTCVATLHAPAVAHNAGESATAYDSGWQRASWTNTSDKAVTLRWVARFSDGDIEKHYGGGTSWVDCVSFCSLTGPYHIHWPDNPNDLKEGTNVIAHADKDFLKGTPLDEISVDDPPAGWTLKEKAFNDDGDLVVVLEREKEQEVSHYTIHFEGNGAWTVNVPTDIVSAVGTTPTIPADPSREGWTFNGWTNAVNDHVYQVGDAFDEGCTKDSTFTLYAKWTATTVSNLDYTDGDGTVWTYDRDGDSVKIKNVVPGAHAETLELPASIKGSTDVQKANGFDLPAKANGLWWHYVERDNHEAALTSVILSGPTGLVMPSAIAGRTVTAFATVSQALVTNLAYITSVDIPGTVTNIPQGAFCACDKLTNIVLHEGTVSIGSDAFGHTALAAPIEFPVSLTNVDPAAFESVGSIPYNANGFMFVDTGKTYLLHAREDVAYAPEGVKTLAMQAFGKTECAKITLPKSVKVYGGKLFDDSSALREVVFKSPAALSYNALFDRTYSVTNVTLYGGEQEVGSFADSPSQITTVGFLTTPPSWDVQSKFPAATTVCYYARYAADWADYKATHTSYAYVELEPECVNATVGQYLACDLVEDLGIEIDADYAAGDKVTVKIEGLAKGLKLTTTQYKETTGKKAVTNVVYTIAGVPTEAADSDLQPMYARVTVTKGKVKTETLTALKLAIKAAAVPDFPMAAIGSNYVASVKALWPSADATWTFKGWPTGLKYTAKDVTAKNKDKSISTNAVAFTVYGKPTKAGVFTITASHPKLVGKTKYTETETASLTVWGDDGKTDFRYTDQAYVATVEKTWPDVKSASGLPTGIKFSSKDGKVSGTPTKPGVFAVTLTKADKSKETFLWKVTEGTNDGFLGAIDWEIRDSTVTVMQGVIQTNWNVTVSSAAKVTATGLPTGLKLAQDRLTKEWTLSGTPTKTGNFVITFKTVLNGVTKTERIAVAVTENAYTGNWYAAPFDNHSASWTAYISVAAGGTVKLTLTEGTTNYNAKGVVQSQVTKTTVTAKNFDGDGTSVYFTLPKNNKVAGSVDRSCVVDFEERKIKINGDEQCADLYLQAPFDFDVPEVATMVVEEFVEGEDGNSTNAFAYLTATYNAAKGLVGVQGKLYDGTAVRATTYALEDANGGSAPFLVTDKSKNAISFLISYTANKGKGEFRLMQCAVFVNGQLLRVGKASLNPSWDGFDSAEAKLLKATKFSDMTSATNLVVSLTADAFETNASTGRGLSDAAIAALALTRDVSVDAIVPIASIAIPTKSLATKLTAQGLVTFKNLKDGDGWTWTCELLPVGEGQDLEDTPFRGIATGTWKNPVTRKTESFVCPVRAE